MLMERELNLHTPVNTLGYGVVGYNLARELSKKVKTNLFLIGPMDFKDSLIEELVNSIENANFDSPTLKIWHQFNLCERIGNGKYYAWPIFELNTFTKQDLISMRAPHEFIVCSKWAKEIVENSSQKPCHVVPLGVDTNIFKPKNENREGAYKFFNIGKWEIRKGHDVLVECFNRAFEAEDNVELHMLCSNPFIGNENNEWEHFYKKSKLGNKIRIHSRLSNHSDVADFINNMNCGVFPARAEGWNLDLLESMSCGIPVIATNYSAHTEFCNKENTYLVDITALEPANDGKWFYGQGEWAYIGELQKEQIIEHMRFCYKNHPANPKGIETGEKLTWENTAEKIYDTIFKSTGI